MKRRNSSHPRKRRGVLKTEAVIAMLLLLFSMNLASALIYRINHLWMDTHRYQFAVNELSNQLDALVRLAPEAAEEKIRSISVSQACEETLGGVSLTGSMIDDELGKRVTLELSWNDRKDAQPVVLSAWLTPENLQGGEP